MKLLKTLFLSTLLLMPVHVKAGAPVVVEMFGLNACETDIDMQRQIQEHVLGNEDVIMINCRLRRNLEKENAKYGHEFCADRAKDYHKKLIGYGEQLPLVIVNGRWDAFFKNIGPAIKMGAVNDHIVLLEMNMNEGVLDISIPALNSEISEGEIVLYAFLPTEGSDALLTSAVEEVIQQKIAEQSGQQSKPFITELEKPVFIMRPLIMMKTIGKWRGQSMKVSYSLNSLMDLAQYNMSDLSFAVTVHEKNTIGPILAAGQILSHVEYMHSFPKSTPAFYDQGMDSL